MAKSKISMEISDRDKKLLMVLLAAGIVAGSYFLGYKPLTEEAEQIEAEYKEMKAKEDDLRNKEANLDTYQSSVDTYTVAYDNEVAKYGKEISEPSNIDFINRVERVTNAWVKSVSFGSATPVYTFGNISSSNPSVMGKAYKSDLVGYKTTLTIAYEAEYDEFKDLITFINEYYSKNVIENVSMTYADVTGIVSGTMTVALYSITGDGVASEPSFSVPTGKDNIFVTDSDAAYSEVSNGEYLISDFDYYIRLNTPSTGEGTIVMGMRSDETNESVIVGRENAAAKVAIEITGSNGSYTVKYSVDGDEYTSRIENNGNIGLLVVSNYRVQTDDEAGMELYITNKSDAEFAMKVINDDSRDSRVKIKETEGNVVIY